MPDFGSESLSFPHQHFLLVRGVKLIVTRGHISPEVAFKGPNVILGLYKCNDSVTVKRELGGATR